ncbi:hypothetical protein Lepto7375DRAFT_1977 [Leptolyngbya sp. PCC 7375]|nr:hypothetical protein Lepto7375DRAFT_1977 [Leptolyngbya sp. PCC 7375]
MTNFKLVFPTIVSYGCDRTEIKPALNDNLIFQKELVIKYGSLV